MADALLRTGRFFSRWDETDDGRAVFREGGRKGDVFYRDRWSHDKVVRSTHGVNCTGSCSWKVYVKDGIITWETQQTDYPVGGTRQPRVRAARLSERRRLQLVHVLADPRPLPLRPRGPGRDVPRGQGPASGTRCSAWADVSATPRRRKRYQPHAARAASCGFRGARHWRSPPPPTSTPSAATAPTGACGFSPIPAMSIVSHAIGTRFNHLIGGAMTSFYDWYADLPVASPQVFGDQTDVPESGDWWDSTYLMMWGSNVPVDPDPGRPLDDRGALPRHQGGERQPRTTPTTPSSPTSGSPPRPAPTLLWRWRWGT